MLVKARKDKNNSWGFLEEYKVYQYYETGYIKALTSVTVDKRLAPVYVFRGEEFVPLEVIDSEMGISKYIKAKKPFYSKVNEGFLVVLKAEVNFKTRKYFPEKSTFELYSLNDGASIDISKGLPFSPVLDIPREFRNVVEEPLRLLGESFGDREKFLRGRLYEQNNS